MVYNRLPKAALYSEGGQYLRYKRLVNRNPLPCSTPVCLRSQSQWRQTIYKSIFDRTFLKRNEKQIAKCGKKQNPS